MLMDALVKAEPGKGLKLMKVEKPVPSFGEVLIKVSKTAICGTDVHIYNWDPWSQQHIHPPMTIGHEYVGHIAELGQGVTGFRVGQRVSGEGHIVCGICRNCRAGNEQWCRHTKGVGVDRNGAFAEYVCIPATNVIPLKDTIPDELVAFFDAYGNAAHTALAFDVAGEDVLVTGAGPIGIMAAAICRHNGARRVVVTDINDYRLGMAKKLGATAVVNTKREDLTAVMKEQGIVEGFDVGLEMSGAAAARNQMIDSMRNGGKIALLGIGGSSEVDWNKIIWNGLTLKGIYGRTYDTWYKLTAMIEAGLDLKPLITHRFDYHDFEKGFEAMNSGNSGKVILDWEGK